jgi:anion-transporting  ArsA/GET3 family ATPase
MQGEVPLKTGLERLGLMADVLKQKIIFVTGKGGVGKSAVAAALALRQSQAGMKTLLVELGYQSFYRDYFSLPEVTYQPQNLRENLDLALWSGPEALKEYARYLLKVESLYKLFFENSVTRALVNVAPALSELAILGKATSHPRKVGPALNYDCIVVDAFATGHFLALLKAPQGMAEAVSFGPMGEQSRSIERVLKDPSYCSYFVVSFPEEMPVIEGQELYVGIEQILNIKPVHIFNKVLNTPEAAFSVQEPQLETFQKYLGKISKQESDLRNKLKSQGQVLEIPQVFSVHPWEVVEKMAEALP